MTRIEEEKVTVRQMVEIYCHGVHHTPGGLCNECSTLLEYAFARLDHCKFGEQKSTCKKCPVHCYKPLMRAAIRHLVREFRH